AERVARPAQAGRTRRRSHFGPGRQEDLFQRLAVQALGLQASRDFAGRRHHEGVDLDALSLEHSRGGAEVGQLSTRARADVGPVESGTADLADGCLIVRTVRLGDDRLQLAHVVDLLEVELRASVGLNDRVRFLPFVAGVDVVERDAVGSYDAVLTTGLD